MEGGYQPAIIETARITNVNLDDWSVDCITEHQYKRHFDLQVSTPYFHFANGEGIYVMPEVGAMVWLCKPSSGQFAAPFIMGFQSPYDEANASFRSARQNLNPGDIMLRTRDENFIVLRRGGVIQIGATPIAQRIYVPIQNYIKDFCENYELNAFGGDLTWVAERDDQTTDGAAPTRFRLRAKQKANDPEHIATLSVGSHGEGDPLTLQLVINDSGEEGATQQVSLSITNDGDVSWALEKDYSIEAKGNVQVTSTEGNVDINSVLGAINQQAGTNWSATAVVNALIEAGAVVEVKAGTSVAIVAPQILFGGSAASSPSVKGDKLVEILTELITKVGALTEVPGVGVTPIPVAGALSVLPLLGKLSGILSKTSFTK
jgi:hypothetical protein